MPRQSRELLISRKKAPLLESTLKAKLLSTVPVMEALRLASSRCSSFQCTRRPRLVLVFPRKVTLKSLFEAGTICDGDKLGVRR